MAKVYAITCYRLDKKTGKRQEYQANCAVWRKRVDALAECRRHLEYYTDIVPVIQTDTNGKQTVLGYKWEDDKSSVEYITYEWPVY